MWWRPPSVTTRSWPRKPRNAVIRIALLGNQRTWTGPRQCLYAAARPTQSNGWSCTPGRALRPSTGRSGPVICCFCRDEPLHPASGAVIAGLWRPETSTSPPTPRPRARAQVVLLVGHVGRDGGVGPTRLRAVAQLSSSCRLVAASHHGQRSAPEAARASVEAGLTELGFSLLLMHPFIVPDLPEHIGPPRRTRRSRQ